MSTYETELILTQKSSYNYEMLYLFFAIFNGLLTCVYFLFCLFLIIKVSKEMSFLSYFTTISILIAHVLRATGAILQYQYAVRKNDRNNLLDPGIFEVI